MERTSERLARIAQQVLGAQFWTDQASDYMFLIELAKRHKEAEEALARMGEV